MAALGSAHHLTTLASAGLFLLGIVGNFVIIPIHVQVILSWFLTIYLGAQR